MTRSIPKIAVDFVAAHEGLKLKAYRDSIGIPTIGFGHIDGVTMGQEISRTQALAFLKEDMQVAVRKLGAALKPEAISRLSEAQWSALLSFTHNVGAKGSWTIWKHVNAGKLDLVPPELMRFTRAGGKVIKGLVNRRADEVKLWNTHDEDAEPEIPPSSQTRLPGMTPPVTDVKPLAQSKTLWAGGIATAGGIVQGAQQIQSLAAPQADNSEWVAKMAALAAFLIVAAGIAVIVFKWMDQRGRRL